MSFRNIALEYLNAGLCVLPGTLPEKRPALPTYHEFHQHLPTQEQVDKWFSWDKADVVCLLCGQVSGGLECVDFDAGGRAYPQFAERLNAAMPGLLDALVVETSPSGGKHLYYRAGVAGPSRKLAQFVDENGELQTLIETRGQGGLAVGNPTPGYRLEQGDLRRLPVVTDAQQEAILETARSLNEWFEPVAEPSPPPGALALDQGRPGDDFNARGDVRAVLQRNGWRQSKGGDNEYWIRPGKVRGHSATLKGGVLYVFSSNAHPFEPGRAYSPFAALAALEYGGDYGQAAAALRRAGFGTSATVTPVAEAHETAVPRKFRVYTMAELEQQFPILREPVIDGLLRRGEVGNLISGPKCYKSWTMMSLACAVVRGQRWMGFDCRPGRVLIVDYELDPANIRNRMQAIGRALDLTSDDLGSQLHFLPVRGGTLDIDELRFASGAGYLQGYDLIVLDPLYRLYPEEYEENDNALAAKLFAKLQALAEQNNSALFVVHHQSKGDQADRSLTDIGAGAGAQSRAADAHIALRLHAQPGAIVMGGVVRSFPPPPERVFRWEYPTWVEDADLDPKDLWRSAPKGGRRGSGGVGGPQFPVSEVSAAAARHLSEAPRNQNEVLDSLQQEGYTRRNAAQILTLMVDLGYAQKSGSGGRKGYQLTLSM